MRHMLMFVFTVVIAGSAFHAASQVTITDDQFTHNAVGRINTAAIVNANAYVYCWLYGNGAGTTHSTSSSHEAAAR